jgi:hypothetical protein
MAGPVRAGHREHGSALLRSMAIAGTLILIVNERSFIIALSAEFAAEYAARTLVPSP